MLNNYSGKDPEDAGVFSLGSNVLQSLRLTKVANINAKIVAQLRNEVLEIT